MSVWTLTEPSWEWIAIVFGWTTMVAVSCAIAGAVIAARIARPRIHPPVVSFEFLILLPPSTSDATAAWRSFEPRVALAPLVPPSGAAPAPAAGDGKGCATRHCRKDVLDW